MRKSTAIVALAACFSLAAQQPARKPVFVEKPLQGPPGPKGEVGPHIGALAPPLEGVDQFGKKQTLRGISGPKGVILIFNLSADT
jgi:hypothetical protein